MTTHLDSQNKILILADLNEDDETLMMYYSRQFATDIQKLRKEAGLHPWNEINIYYKTEFEKLRKSIEDYKDYITNIVRYPVLNNEYTDDKLIINKDLEINDMNINVTLAYQ